jgi:hypothetical protein
MFVATILPALVTTFLFVYTIVSGFGSNDEQRYEAHPHRKRLYKIHSMVFGALLPTKRHNEGSSIIKR